MHWLLLGPWWDRDPSVTWWLSSFLLFHATRKLALQLDFEVRIIESIEFWCPCFVWWNGKFSSATGSFLLIKRWGSRLGLRLNVDPTRLLRACSDATLSLCRCLWWPGRPYEAGRRLCTGNPWLGLDSANVKMTVPLLRVDYLMVWLR